MPSPGFDGDTTDTHGGRIRVRPVGQGRACLIMMTGAFPGETYLLAPNTEMTIGRGAGNDIRLPYNDVSRVHARAKCSASGKVEMTDLGSMNGTYVNGRRQLYRVLREGDKIQFGEKTVFRFAFLDEVDEEFQSRLLGAPFLDRVTTTLTRDRLLARVEEGLRGAGPGGELTLVVLAVDGIDLVGDLLGFAVRDYFLRELCWIIRKAVAGEATLYRVAQDAFATVVPDLGMQQAVETAERMRRAVSSARLTHQGDQMLFSLAVGVADLKQDGPADAASMLALAELRCRQACAEGGDRIQAAGG